MARAPKRFGLTLAAIVRDEADYLPEWIEYHGLIGVEHFYIYDNGSRDVPAQALSPYIVQGRATLLSWPEFPGQISAYNHAVKVFGRDSDWMGLIDADEFIQLEGGEALPAFLARIAAEADQVLMPWVHFGASGHETRPPGLVTESYVHRVAEAHLQPKSIVRPETVVWAHEHHCTTRAGRTIDPAGDTVPERWILPRPPRGPVRVNHYLTKSRAEFSAKLVRGQADGGRGKTSADFDRFATPVHDASMRRWTAPIRAALAETAARHGVIGHAPWSAQSEIAPCRRWTLAVGEALRAIGDNDAQRELDVDRALLRGGTVMGAAGAAVTVRKALAARPIGDATMTLAPGATAMLSLDPAELGRAYLACHGETETPAKITLACAGVDAANKPYAAENILATGPGTSIAFAALAQRTLRAERLSLRNDGPAPVALAVWLDTYL